MPVRGTAILRPPACPATILVMPGAYAGDHSGGALQASRAREGLRAGPESEEQRGSMREHGPGWEARPGVRSARGTGSGARPPLDPAAPIASES